MASRRTEKQKMLRAYEAEQKKERIQEELERRQEEEAEKAAYYDYDTYKEEQKKEEERKKCQLEACLGLLYEIEMSEATYELEKMLRSMQGQADYW